MTIAMATKTEITFPSVSLPNVTDNGEAVERGCAISQAISYIPYGEVFVEQQAGGWSSPYLFNAKELDSETGLYYYGARYLDPSDAMWLSVDPLWEKNIDASPYSYCHGNPLVMIDPDGKDDYGVDEQGNVFLIKRTDSKSDKIISGVRQKVNKRNGLINIKGLKYRKDGSLRNSNIDVKKGCLSRKNRTHYEFPGGKGLTYNFSLDDYETDSKTLQDQIEKIFKFFAKNTSIEWSFYNKVDKDKESFHISTSFEQYTEKTGANDVYKAKENGITVDFHYHSHPDDYNATEIQNALPSDKDINFKKKMESLGGNTIFKIFSRGSYREY